MKKRLVSIALIVFILFCTSFAANAENVFPPQRPEVGVMKMAVSRDGNVVVGLRTNGTINITANPLDNFGKGISDELKNRLLSLTDIVDVACTFNAVAALRSDGTVYVGENEGENFFQDLHPFAAASDWTDIVSIACGDYHLIGLKSDGTVVSAHSSRHDSGAQNVQGWTDVASIYAYGNYSIAVTKHGDVLPTGDFSGTNTITNIGVDIDSATLKKMKNVKSFSSNPNVGISTDGNVFPLIPVGTAAEYSFSGIVVSSTAEYVPLEELLRENSVDISEANGNTIEIPAIQNSGTHLGTIESLREGILGTAGNKDANTTKEETPAEDAPKKKGLDINIVSVETIPCGGFQKFLEYAPLLVLDDKGDLYEITFEMLNPAQGHVKNAVYKKINENICYVIPATDIGNLSYYAVDNNGEIWSYGDAITFSSSDWILTTNIVYNGEKIHSDVAPYIKDGRTLAPIRVILEALGMEVDWDPNTRTAIAIKGDITIKVTIDSTIAIVNGEEKVLDVPAEITHSRTFVPVRFFAEALDLVVDWNGNSKTVIITSK